MLLSDKLTRILERANFDLECGFEDRADGVSVWKAVEPHPCTGNRGRLGRSHFDLECEISILEVEKATYTGHQQV